MGEPYHEKILKVRNLNFIDPLSLGEHNISIYILIDLLDIYQIIIKLSLD